MTVILGNKTGMALIKSAAQIQARKEQILAWLLSEAMVKQCRQFRNGGGFAISGRVRMQVGDQVVPANEFLRSELFADGDVVGEYRVRINPPNGQYVENFSFFLQSPVVSVPKFE